jgi:hypothetical protein
MQKGTVGTSKASGACTQAMVAIGEAKLKRKLIEELIDKIKLRMAFNAMQHAAAASRHLASLVSHTVVSNNCVLMEAVFNAWKRLVTDKHAREQQACQYSVLAQRMRFRAGVVCP